MITIIGAGLAGKALGEAFIKAGKKVFFGVSTVPKYKDTISALGKYASVGTVEEALAAASEIVILATPYTAALSIARSVADWKGKILVDITTPRLPDFTLTVGLTTSGGELIAQAAINARVVKAFNTMGAESMRNPSIVEGKVFMPVCSDDQNAKQEIIKLGSLIGFHAVDTGALSNARATEPLAFLWLQLSFNVPIGRTFEFGLLNKKMPKT